MKRKAWVFTPKKPVKIKPSEKEKQEISEKCQPFVEAFKKKFIKSNPNKNLNYIVDIYTKWYQNYLYFCEKRKSESPHRIQDGFETKFVRLTYKGSDCFDFSYFRHTGQWFLVQQDLSLQSCLELIEGNRNFQPLG